MQAQTWADLPFADGIYRFGLDMGGILAIEAKLGVGIGAIQARTLAGRWSPDPDHFDPRLTAYVYREVVEVIRESLIRGAFCIVDGVEKRVTQERANDLVTCYLDTIGPQQMLVNNAWALAWNIIAGRIIGYDSSKKAEPAEEPATPTSPKTGENS